MIEILKNLIPDVLKSLKSTAEWDSLIINKRKPYTYRVFRKFGNYRVCLHAFDECSTEESFAHPHPWPGAFLILKGSYVHTIGFSKDTQSEPVFLYKEILKPNSIYEIADERVWHSVQPLERTYTIMVNGEPWGNPHKDVRTTKGKDLERMNDCDLNNHLKEFSVLLSAYSKTLKSTNAECKHQLDSINDPWIFASAYCKLCNKDLGWRCKESPDQVCHYYNELDNNRLELIDGSTIEVFMGEIHDTFEECCLFCGLPDERK